MPRIVIDKHKNNIIGIISCINQSFKSLKYCVCTIYDYIVALPVTIFSIFFRKYIKSFLFDCYFHNYVTGQDFLASYTKMNQPQADSIVIQQVLLGNSIAYGVLVDRYQSYVYTLVLRYINNTEQAEELAQDVFIKAYRMLPGFKGESKFSTWLYTIVHTTCLSYLRRDKKDIILLEQEQLAAAVRQNEDPGLKLEQISQKQLLEHAISQLPTIDAEIITLYYMAEQSVEEVSKTLTLSIENIKVRLFRSRQKLKEILTTQFIDSI